MSRSVSLIIVVSVLIVVLGRFTDGADHHRRRVISRRDLMDELAEEFLDEFIDDVLESRQDSKADEDSKELPATERQSRPVADGYYYVVSGNRRIVRPGIVGSNAGYYASANNPAAVTVTGLNTYYYNPNRRFKGNGNYHHYNGGSAAGYLRPSYGK